MRKIPASVLLYLLAGAAFAGPLPERRREQFRGDFGYAAIPFVYDLPGIGKGYGFLGGAANIAGSHTDVTGSLFEGDVSGQALAVDQIHLLPGRLVLDVGVGHLSRVSLQSYAARGMGADKDDYSIAEFVDSWFYGGRLTASFLDRRMEPFLGYYAGALRLKSLRDRDGEVFLDAADAARQTLENHIAGVRFDLTDDALDPHRGLRIEPSLWRSPPRGEAADFMLTNLAATAYLPVGRRNTWAFNYFRSDALVLEKGLSDRAAIERDLGLDCSSVADPADRAACRDFVETALAANTHGTATALGGISRLRSYAEGRFQGAHSEFFGTEYRWNVSDQVRPFDIYLMRDIRTALQFAFFYEIGSVADSRGALWKKSRSSYGGGFRLVAGSGVVYRVDLAGGQEGVQPSIFFQYPWELF